MKYIYIYTLALLFAGMQTFAQTYTYDDQNRLTKVVYENGTTVTYTYDALGNRTKKKVTGATGIYDFTVTVTASPDEGGTVLGGGSYPNGTVIELIAAPNDGYDFVAWNDGVTDNPRYVTITHNMSFTALFALSSFTTDWAQKVILYMRSNQIYEYGVPELTDIKFDEQQMKLTVNKTNNQKDEYNVLQMDSIAFVDEDVTLLTDGLVAYYPFNGNANDESGNGNHGTPSNIELALGVNGDTDTAYQFGGIDNPGYIYVPNSESLQFTDGATFSAYVKPTSWTNMDGYGYKTESNGVHCIFAKDHDQSGVAFFLRGNDDDISFWTSWGDISCQASGYFLNKWIHVAFVYGDGYARLYVNGQLMDEKESTTNFSRVNGRNLYIGKFRDSWYPFSGLIDEVRIYNRALTGSEIKTLAH